MSFSFFILGFLFLPDMLWWVWADRRARGRRWVRGAVALFMLFMAGHVLWILLLPDTARRSHEWIPVPLIAATYLWHLLVLPAALVGILLVAGVRLVARRPRPTDESRRGFLALCAVAAPPVATAAAVVFSLDRLDRFRVRRLQLGVPGLPDALDGLTIAQVSDLHYGKFTRKEAVDRIVAETNALAADLVLLTGDLIDLSVGDLDAALEVVKRLDRRQGLFMCEGNHDLIDDPEGFRQRVKASGVPILLDETATTTVHGARVQLCGVRWRRGGDARRESLARVRKERDAGAFPILLAHHPHTFDDAADFPLTLSGHTHGGQLMWNERLGAGPVLFRYWSGVYRRDERALVVTNGVGNWFPLRTHAPAEIVHLTLRTVG